jgi:hypothetical protein
MFLERTVVLAFLIGVVGCTEKQGVVGSDARADRRAPAGAMPSIEEIAQSYEELKLITKEPVEVGLSGRGCHREREAAIGA